MTYRQAERVARSDDPRGELAIQEVGRIVNKLGVVTGTLVTLLIASLVASVPGVAQSPSASAPFDPNSVRIRFEPFASGLEEPTYVTGSGSGDGSLFAVEQGGTIRRIHTDGTVEESPFLDITDRVQGGGEQGLLGLALHPDFPEDDRYYVYYTRASDQANVVSEFRPIPTDSERVILEMPDFASNHNGGMLAFDPDGMLLIATGDGGGGGDPEENGQDLGSLLGKILRIDIESGDPYAIPADNPFADVPDARPEIWMYGLRNPWRFSVDRATRDLWIGDVGQGAWEEINRAPADQSGLNFGWNVMEGPDCFEAPDCDPAAFVAPVVAVSHDEGVCSIIGGYVYRGTAYPDLVGGYLFTDYCTGRIDLLDPGQLAQGDATRVEAGSRDGSITSFGEDDNGELYAVDQGGEILRVVAEPAA
jgi:glucose/arabinose dehydrogenase